MEVDLTGVDPLTHPEVATWEWQIAMYLFIGGLVAGILIIGAVLRLRRAKGFDRALRIAELAALPLIVVGLLLLFSDLGNGWNSWRFYTTFEITSAMSWGSWILMVATVGLVLRSTTQLLDIRSSISWLERPLHIVQRVGEGTRRRSDALDWTLLALGGALGVYTGVLLSTIPARPLWDSFVLAPLFLVSGIATGGAFLCLFLEREPHLRLVPVTATLSAIEVALIGGLVVNLWIASDATKEAAKLLLGGRFGFALFGGVLLFGLLIPVSIEGAEWARRRVPGAFSRVAPYLKLTGGLVLRFVVVYAGLESAL